MGIVGSGNGLLTTWCQAIIWAIEDWSSLRPSYAKNKNKNPENAIELLIKTPSK